MEISHNVHKSESIRASHELTVLLELYVSGLMWHPSNPCPVHLCGITLNSTADPRLRTFASISLPSLACKKRQMVALVA